MAEPFETMEIARRRSKIRLRAYRPGDETAFTPRKDFAEDAAAVAWPWGEGPPPGRVSTLYLPDAPPREGYPPTGQVLGIGGVWKGDDGRFEAWACLGDLPRKDWPRAIMYADIALKWACLELPQHDLHAAVTATARADNPGAEIVLKRLGFIGRERFTDPRLPGVVLIRGYRRR